MKTAFLFFKKLDFKAILRGLTLPLIYWILQVVLVTLFRYPGVICLTPFAWLLAWITGRECALHSRSQVRRTRLIEASLAGGLLGFFHGLLFVLVTALGFQVRTDELFNVLLLDAGVLLGGSAFCAALAWLAAQRYSRLGSIQTAPRAPMPGASAAIKETPCPICSQPRPTNPRYPNAVCSTCIGKAVDENKRSLKFYNADLSSGLKIVYADTGEERADPTCMIDGIRCRVEEARMGGIVVKPEL